jgi:hypothetical protein
MKNLRTRFWWTAGLAAASIALFAATIITPDWIEAVLRFDPDSGSGTAEWVIALILGLVAAAASVLSVVEWRRTAAQVTA